MSEKKLPAKFDYVVVGNSFTSALLARVLEVQNKLVAWVLRPETLGELIYFSVDEANAQRLKSLLALSGLQVDFVRCANRAKTTEGTQLRDFVGFGDKKITAAEEFTVFAQPEIFEFSMPVWNIRHHLRQQFNGHLYEGWDVTEVKIDNRTAQALVLNGTVTLQADHIIYGDQLNQLERILPYEGEAGKLKQKLARAEYYSTVNLEIQHKQKLQPGEISPLILTGNVNETEAVVGHIFPSAEGVPGQMSKWMSVLASEQIDDSEYVGGVIKLMKRLAKKVFQDGFDPIVKEKIGVSMNTRTDLKLKLDEEFSYGHLKGIHLVGPYKEGLPAGVAGGIEAAHEFLNNLGLLNTVDSIPSCLREPDLTANELPSL